MDGSAYDADHQFPISISRRGNGEYYYNNARGILYLRLLAPVITVCYVGRHKIPHEDPDGPLIALFTPVGSLLRTWMYTMVIFTPLWPTSALAFRYRSTVQQLRPERMPAQRQLRE